MLKCNANVRNVFLQGILKEVEEDIYRITDEFPVSLLNEDEGQKDAEKFILEPDIDSPLTSAAAQREAELEVRANRQTKIFPFNSS